ncbi:MAG: peptide-methionine (R)-S-oxide reductase MsrB [Candidatus Yanofskybacteria bacterium]|nr:peptide-methionine (R)-S-oxide reductase MsrB [Candidatus Yanofskybacteria bacterium]
MNNDNPPAGGPKTESEWKTCLTPEQYKVLREKGTEAAFTGKYYKNKEAGMYVCGACGQELFSSDTKFDSGTGWPSFTDPVNREHIELKDDSSHGMSRTEVLCKKCGSHLGHVFPDGPKNMPDGTPASGQRYCINSLSLDFKSRA